MSVKANPNDAAQAWATGFGQAGQKYVAGIQAVKTSPTQLAAARSAFWASQVAAARPQFEQGLNKVSLSSWQQSATTTGAARLSTGATKGQPKVQAFMTNFIPALANIVNGLPARGDFGANMNRFTSYATALHNAKGSF